MLLQQPTSEMRLLHGSRKEMLVRANWDVPCLALSPAARQAQVGNPAARPFPA